MALAREPIVKALAERLTEKLGVPVFRKNLRRDQVGRLPAIILLGENQVPNQSAPGLPAVWTVNVRIGLAFEVPNGQDPDVEINEWAAKLEKALERDPTEGFVPGAAFIDPGDTITTSLGGLVSGIEYGEMDSWEASQAQKAEAGIEWALGLIAVGVGA